MSEQETIDTLQGQIAALKGAKEVAEDNLLHVTSAFKTLIGIDVDTLAEQIDEVKQDIIDLNYKVDNIEDEYEMVDTVVDSTRFESAVEDTVRDVLNETKVRLEVR